MARDRYRVDRSGRFDPETFSERKFLVKDDYGKRHWWPARRRGKLRIS
jgi:hypothetical protein